MPDAAGWNRLWYGGGASWPLRPLSWLFGALAGIRRASYAAGILRSESVGAPVVVVGNLSVGGTGKTPLVIWLARALHERGIAVGIASRGYGSATQAPRLVSGASTAAEVGDEPLLMQRRAGVPVCVAARRVAAARRLVESGCRIVLCDDGLQHYALRRDCEIVVVDAAHGFGNGQLLPAGPLREKPERLRRVDLVVLNGEGDVPLPALARAALHMRLVGDTVVSSLPGPPPRPLHELRGQRVHAVAGIGNPARFFTLLRDHGVDPIEHAFADHHAFVAADLRFADGLPVLMTEKDAVKCKAFAEPGHGYVPVEARFDANDSATILQHVARLVTGEN